MDLDSLPPKIDQPLPSLSTVLGDSNLKRNDQEDSFLYNNQYAPVQSPLLNYPYNPQPIYYNPWQYAATPYDIYQPYPFMVPYDQQTILQPPIIEVNNNFCYDTSSSSSSSMEGKPASVETVKDSSPESEKMAPKVVQRRTRRLNRNVSCSNCSTSDTSLWRKNENGDLECNACNLYYRLNKVPRPQNLAKHPPRTRNRRSVKGKKSFVESEDD